MSRVSVLEQLYGNKNKKNALEFNYEALIAPPIRSLFYQEDINKLYKIATSIRYNANIEKKYELIDEIMRSRGFRRAHCGTNRVVYNSIYDTTFVAKVAIDRVGMQDSPAEFKNQEFFKPFCCKIFEVDPTGVLAFVERVNPITSLEEFLSVSDDIFNMMITKIIGKYVVDDLGTSKFMNYGLRYNSYTGHTFGPVIIDYPYAYETDGAKLICQKILPNNTICGGEIDYDIGFNNLYCTRCGKKYTAMELKKDSNNILIIHDEGDIKMRVRLLKNNKVVLDSGLSSKNYITEEEYNSFRSFDNNDIPIDKPVPIKERKIIRKKSKEQYFNKYFVEPQIKFYEQENQKNKMITKKVIKIKSDNCIEDKEDTKDINVNSIKISKITDIQNNNVIYNNTENINAEAIKEEIIPDAAIPEIIEEQLEIDKPIDNTVIQMQERENIYMKLTDEMFSVNDNISISDSVDTVNESDKDNDSFDEKINDEKQQNKKYTSIEDYHGDDNNYNMKQKRANKRKNKKYYKNRNHGFNKYDDDDINNF